MVEVGFRGGLCVCAVDLVCGCCVSCVILKLVGSRCVVAFLRVFVCAELMRGWIVCYRDECLLFGLCFAAWLCVWI